MSRPPRPQGSRNDGDRRERGREGKKKKEKKAPLIQASVDKIF